jgi:hypothetical protein
MPLLHLPYQPLSLRRHPAATGRRRRLTNEWEEAVSGQKTQFKAAPAFDEVFGVPIGHVLRQVSSAPVAGARAGRPRWEHEEYDPHHGLVAVYESWLREDGDLAFVKYSPHGWVLSISGRCPRRPPPKVRARPAGAV